MPQPPPDLGDLVDSFDTSSLDPIRRRRHLGWVTENATPRDLGFLADVNLIGPHAFVPVPPNATLDVEVPVDRLRDARWLWTREDVRGAIEGAPSEDRRAADRIVRVSSGAVYEVQQVVGPDAYCSGLRGFLLLRVPK